MTDYKILKHPLGKIYAVKQGWSWPAFFFTYFWALFKKLWLKGVCALIVIPIIVLIIDEYFGKACISYGLGGIGAWFGSEGNKWLERSLLSRGYDHIGTVKALNPEGAIALYIKGDTGVGSNSNTYDNQESAKLR